MRSGLCSAFLISVLAVAPLGAETIPGRYIVFSEAGGPLKGAAAIRGEVIRELRLENFPSGWVVRMSAETAKSAARDGYLVTPDFRLKAFEEDPPEQVEGPLDAWHLDRSDQRALSFDGLYRYSYTGAGVRAYVFDTGIHPGPEFGSRLDPGASFISDGKGVFETCGDRFTHATVIAGLLAGQVYGIAKSATVVPVRVIACDGFVEGAAWFEAMDWVLSDLRKHPGTRAVINMSFGGEGIHPTLDRFFKKFDEAGVVLVDAANNRNEDACGDNPAGSRYTITVGETNKEDRRWLYHATSGSNFGKCVDLFAPAQDVINRGGRDHNVLISSTGTSNAAPQVAGHIAQLLEQFPDAMPAMIRKLLLANATPGVLSDLGAGSPNLLLYAGTFRETAARFIPRWFPEEGRFTLQLRVEVPGGGVSPAEEVRLFRGPKRDGRCQGQPFSTARLEAGGAVVTVRGWKQAPAFVCGETSLGTVFDRFVRTLN